jgi:hypothetical protein
MVWIGLIAEIHIDLNGPIAGLVEIARVDQLGRSGHALRCGVVVIVLAGQTDPNTLRIKA